MDAKKKGSMSASDEKKKIVVKALPKPKMTSSRAVSKAVALATVPGEGVGKSMPTYSNI